MMTRLWKKPLSLSGDLCITARTALNVPVCHPERSEHRERSSG
jgi:hypothetical protein